MTDSKLSVCCHCGKVKDWHGNYSDSMVLSPELQELVKHGELSHGICEDCLEKHYNYKKDQE